MIPYERSNRQRLGTALSYSKGTYGDMGSMAFAIHWIRIGYGMGITGIESVACEVVPSEDLLSGPKAIGTEGGMVVVNPCIDARGEIQMQFL